jgi:kynureninase
VSATVTLQAARALDAADPLRGFRARFAQPTGAHGAAKVYLCGHSLGLMPLAARDLVMQELDDWARLGVEGHEHAHRPWIPYHENLTAGLAALAGAHAGEVVAMNTLTVNLHLMLASFYRPQGTRRRILIEAGAFSSDRHAVTSHLAWHGMDPAQALIELAAGAGEDTVSEDAIEACLEQYGPQIALVLWPAVQFRTGQAFDVARIARAAHRHGCLAGFDLAHSIGNMPMSLHAADADFAVWCSYKYLNAGPGAIGGCFVHQRHVEALPPSAHTGAIPGARLAGWWGHEERSRFLMEPQFRAAPGVAAWQLSNPSVFASAPLIASLGVFMDAGLGRLRHKSVALTGFLEELLRGLESHLQVITPADPAQRGCQLSVRIIAGAQRGREVLAALGARGIVVDFRAPDIIRVAPVPLYNGFEDAWQFAHTLRELLHR